MKKSHKRTLLVAEVEKPITSGILRDIVGVLTTAVAVFNCEKNKVSDWREHLKSYITGGYSIHWESYEYGFSGDHFWVHDAPGTMGERVLMIYSLNVVVPH